MIARLHFRLVDGLDNLQGQTLRGFLCPPPRGRGHGWRTSLVTELVPPKQNWLRPAEAPTTKNSKQSGDGLTVTMVSGASSNHRSSGWDASKLSMGWFSMIWRNDS